jgi:GntR family transcriptional regulator
LGLTEGELVCVRSRRHILDDNPVLVSTSYLPAALAAGTPITQADTGPGGIYARLAEIGHAPTRFVEELRFRMPTADETTRLNLAIGSPVIQIARTAHTGDSRVVELNEMTLDANAYILEYAFDA